MHPPSLEQWFGRYAPAVSRASVDRDARGRSGRLRMTERALVSGLFDHFVGADEDRWRDRQAEFFCSLKIDRWHEFGWLFDRQIGGCVALEDLVHIPRGLPETVDRIGAVRHQPTGIDYQPVVITCGNAV